MWRVICWFQKACFEPRGTESRRSTTPSHGNMRLRLSSTETLKRVLVVPPTKIMFYYYVSPVFFQSQKKRRELSILIDTKLPLAPMPRYKNPVSKNESGILSQKMLFPPCKVVVDFFFDEEERRYAITRRQRK